MEIMIDIPQTKEEIEHEIKEQIKEFRRIGLLPFEDIEDIERK